MKSWIPPDRRALFGERADVQGLGARTFRKTFEPQRVDGREAFLALHVRQRVAQQGLVDERRLVDHHRPLPLRPVVVDER